MPWADRVTVFLATGCGLGRLPVAPGTFGTLPALALHLVFAPLAAPVLAIILVAMFVMGVWLCGAAERLIGGHDPPSIVFDEIVGGLLALSAVRGAPWPWMVVAFCAFRLFDIWKPGPIGTLDRRYHGGFGTMVDDLAAGAAAFVVVGLLQYGVDGP